MAVDAMTAARRICENGSWRITNLQVQKLLYLAQMLYMGRTKGKRLVDASFEAWDYGPVVPRVYHKVRVFGDAAIRDIFFGAPAIDVGASECKTIDEVCRRLQSKRPAELVAMTHWERGAWARNYIPGRLGIVIPDTDILAEYSARTAAT